MGSTNKLLNIYFFWQFLSSADVEHFHLTCVNQISRYVT